MNRKTGLVVLALSLLAQVATAQMNGGGGNHHGSQPSNPGGSPSDVEVHPAYTPFAGSDALEVLVAKNVLASFGDEGYAHGWKWDSYVNATFTKDEKPPAPK